MSVKIYVWLPKGGKVGHSSMQVGDRSYISFWPGSDRKGFIQLAIRKMTMNVKRRPVYRDYDADRATEGFEPMTIELTSLDEVAILSYWQKVQLSDLDYELTEFNCSTIIANALYMGSGLQSSFQPLAEIDLYVGLGIPLGEVEAWEPKHILQYAKQIKRLKG